MIVEQTQIKHVVKTQRNFELALQYAARGDVAYLKVHEHGDGYIIKAGVHHGEYENICHIQLDQHMRILSYDCDCPYCSDLQACAHIGAVLFQLNKRKPEHVPYTYVKQQGDIEEPQLLDYEIRLHRLQEERRQRWQAEREKRELQNQLDERRQRLSYTHQMIMQEKDMMLKQMCVDHSGSVKLMIVLEHTAVTSYEYGISFSLRLGKTRMYVIKHVFAFLEDVREHREIRYGRELQFVHDRDAFDEESQKILDFLERYEQELERTMRTTDRRNPFVTDRSLRDLYELCEQIPSAYCMIPWKKEPVSFAISIHQQEADLQLECTNYPRLIMGYHDESGLYQIEQDTLIHYTVDANGKLVRLLESLHSFNGGIWIAHEDLNAFANYIWRDCQSFIQAKGDVSAITCTEMEELHLYGDLDEQGQMSIRLEGMHQGTRLYGFDASMQEVPLELELAEAYIKNFASVIDPVQHIAYLPQEDDSTYAFIKEGLPFLSEYCDIYISDSIEKLGSVHHVHIQTGVKLSNHLLELSFDSQDISRDELFEVLRSYRKKRKYHRLKNGRLLSLDAQELSALEEVVDTLHIQEQEFVDGHVRVPSYRAFSLAPLMEDAQEIHYVRSEALSKLLADFSRKNLTEYALPQRYEPILRDYQKFGYQWMKLMSHYHFGAILADDMGLGKTLQVIALLESEKRNGFSLVVTPSSLLLNWRDEIQRFSDELHVCCIMGPKGKREEAIRQCTAYDVVITSYDYMRRDVALYESIEFHYIVLDEAQYIKNQGTMNARAVKQLQGRNRLALTGTPIENSLAELWSIFDFLMPGYLYPYHYFVQEYERPIVKEHDEEKQAKLKRLVEPFLLRRNKKEVLKELPDKVEHTLKIAFDEEEEALYRASLLQISTQLQEKSSQGTVDRIQILAMLTRLRQLCCEPRLIYENIDHASSKLKACIELCLSLRKNHQSVLLFSSFTTVLTLLEKELQKYHFHYLKLTGDHSKEERHRMVHSFQKGDTDVFLISLKAGGTGLNLTAAQAVIHFDPWWNISAQNQATDRAYRIGQEKNLQVFKLIMQDSIEEKIQQLQKRKKNLADTFVEHSAGSIASMELDDLMSLFQM